MNAGQIIKDARLRAGLTSQQLADRVSTSKTAISEIENGRRGVSVDKFDALLGAMGSQKLVVVSPTPPPYEYAYDVMAALVTGNKSRAYRRIIGLADQLLSLDEATRIALCVTPPRSTGSPIHDAALAGIVEFCLSGLPQPEWLHDDWRTMSSPQPFLEGTINFVPELDEVPPALLKHGVLIDERSLRGV